MTYLKRHPKTGIYFFRRAIPAELRPSLGKGREWTESLKTKNAVEAKSLVQGVAARVDALFQQAREQAEAKKAETETPSHLIGRNQLLSFVQTMIALEMLLGDKQRSDLMGLSELLRNRCAYLIGKDQRQREEILDNFGRIYDLRSQIVHRGESRLSREEQILFYKLRWMCIRVIQEEIRLLEAAVA